jgi:hypothetical protein
MGQGISEVLPFAIGIAISPIPIVAVILILFSNRARVNGPAFLLGWVVGIALVGSVVYFVLDAANAATDTTTSDSVSWGKIVLGVLLLGLVANILTLSNIQPFWINAAFGGIILLALIIARFTTGEKEQA